MHLCVEVNDLLSILLFIMYYEFREQLHTLFFLKEQLHTLLLLIYGEIQCNTQ
jgi:hypothetical protein